MFINNPLLKEDRKSPFKEKNLCTKKEHVQFMQKDT